MQIGRGVFLIEVGSCVETWASHFWTRFPPTTCCRIAAPRQITKKRHQKMKITYNSRDSLVVTHPTTNLPIWGLCMAERTGCPILLNLWSYVKLLESIQQHILLFAAIRENIKRAYSFLPPLYKVISSRSVKISIQKKFLKLIVFLLIAEVKSGPRK